MCTQTVLSLYNPIPTNNAITTKLRYDLGKPCSRPGDRLVMVVGTVQNRFGASDELCNREPESLKRCPFVALSVIPDFKPAALIADVQGQLGKNQITSMQAVEDLTFAMQARQRQVRQQEKRRAENDDNSDGSGRVTMPKEQEQEVLTVLSMLKEAANDTVGVGTSQTPRVQGL